jgi:hypothetical protein
MHQTTQLAHGQITNHDEIVVILVEPTDRTPALVQVPLAAAPHHSDMQQPIRL